MPQTNVTFDGVDAGASGLLADNQQSWAETLVNGPGQLSFRWRVSSESGFDRLVLTLDGVQQVFVSGEVPWTQQTLVVPAGSHKLRWTYAKDGSVAEGQDRAWLDQVAYTPGTGVLQPVSMQQPKFRTRDGLFQFDVTGEPGKNVTVILSTNLSAWVPLVTLPNPTGAIRFIDSSSTNSAKSFYRLRTP